MPTARQILILGSALVVLLIAASIYLGPVTEEKIGVDPAAGRQFAERNCAGCHAIGDQGTSPVAAAPPFRTFARLWPLESIEEALAQGIEMDHPGLPRFKLTPRQIADFIAYLDSIQR